MKICSFFSRIMALALSIICLIAPIGCGNSDDVKCPDCGEKNDSSAKFCRECGQILPISIENDNGNDGDDVSESTNDDQKAESEHAANIWLKLREQSAGQQKIGMHYEYSYDFNGNLILRRYVADESGQISASHKYIYTYDENDRVIKIEIEGGATEKEYTYDVDGNLHEEYEAVGNYKIYEKGLLKYQYQRKAEWYELREYKYDSNGNLTSEYLYEKTAPLPDLRTFDNARKLRDTDFGESFLNIEYTYDSNGIISKHKIYSVRYDLDKGVIALTGETIDFIHTSKTDSDGNVIEESIIGSTGYKDSCTYEYISLAEYREKGLYVSSDVDGSIYCTQCKNLGYDKCQGHNCTECGGDGQMTCPGCKGTGKEPFEINGNDTCYTCLGEKTMYCKTCKGTGKWFFDPQ